MKKILLPCITSVMLTFLFCSLFTQPEPSLNHLDEKIDEAKKQSIKPIHDYFAKPESLIIYPRKETKYTFLCCRTSSVGGLQEYNYNYELTKNWSFTAPFYLNYSKYPSELNSYLSSDYISHTDSLLMSPVTDTVYYTAFRDTDGQHVLLYYANYSYKSCFQIFKEGLGLVYECVHNSDGDGKNTLLSKVDGVSIDITSLLSRITGMIYAFTDLCQQSATVITISRSDFDSVQVYEHKKYKLLFNIQSDTTFTVAHENLWDLNLWSNGKGQSIFIPSYDTIAVTGITYKSVGKIPYHDYFW